MFAFPARCPSSRHRLFLPALLLASSSVSAAAAFLPPSTAPRASPHQQRTLHSTTITTHMSAPSSRDVHLANGLRDMAHQYDAFLIDQWGVMHDGHHPYPGSLKE